MSDDGAVKIAQLLHQVDEVHHVVFADTDGNGALRALPHCLVAKYS